MGRLNNSAWPFSFQDTAKLLLGAVMGFGLNQHVNEPTRRGNILDLVFSNNASLVRGMTVEPGVSDHGIVVFDVDLSAKWKREPRRKYMYVRKQMKTWSILSWMYYRSSFLQWGRPRSRWNGTRWNYIYLFSFSPITFVTYSSTTKLGFPRRLIEVIWEYHVVSLAFVTYFLTRIFRSIYKLFIIVSGFVRRL